MVLENTIDLVNTYGPGIAFVAIVIFVLLKLASEHGPKIIDRYQKRRTDQVEHTQEIERSRLRHEELLALSEADSRTYTEGQLTQHLAEVYGEFHEVNKFVREGVSLKLIRIEAKLEQILCNTDNIPETTKTLIELNTTVKALHVRLDEVMQTIDEGENDRSVVS